MIKISRKVRDASTAAAVGLALLGALVAFQRHKSGMRAELGRLRAEASSLQSPSQRTPILREQIAALRTQLEDFQRKTPYQPDISVLLAELGSDLPADAGGDREIVMRPTMNGSQLNRNPIVLRMKGACDSGLNLLRRIEGYRCLTRVSRIQMDKKRPESDDPPQFEVEFMLFSRASAEALSCNE